MSWYGRTQTHSSPHRRQHLHCLLEQRSKVNRNQYCEQLSASWKRAWRSSACVCPTETLNTDLTSDIEAPREDVEIGNEEDEEPLEAEVPKTRMNPKNPTSRKKQEHEGSVHAVYRSWCSACVEGRGVRGRHRIEQLNEEKTERMTPIVALDYGFMTLTLKRRCHF